MPADLQMTAIDLDPESLGYSGEEYVELFENLQGNILQSHGRDFATHLFLAFGDDATAAREWIAGTVAPLITSAGAQLREAAAHRATGADAGPFANFALSAAGYRALGFGEIPDDPSFLRGMKPPGPLEDPPASSWEAGFQGAVHALVLLADDDAARLERSAAAIQQGLGTVASVVQVEQGEVLRNARGEPIEPFGFADGVSQPLFMAADIEAARQNGGLDRFDPSAPLGLALLPDPGSRSAGCGSYLVYRKLAQDVEGFRAQEAALATALQLDAAHAELAGAYAVGRFRDGTPVVTQPVDGWVNEPTNFDYDDDADGMRCPLHAHTRKTNPRGDKLREFGIPPGEDRTRRIARRAVPYPPSPKAGDEVGLLFACAQSSILHQFEFIQAIWSNNTGFLRSDTGPDPIIGQGSPSTPQQWPAQWGKHVTGTVSFAFESFVTLRGGEYFFLPSLDFLQAAAQAT